MDKEKKIEDSGPEKDKEIFKKYLEVRFTTRNCEWDKDALISLTIVTHKWGGAISCMNFMCMCTQDAKCKMQML